MKATWGGGSKAIRYMDHLDPTNHSPISPHTLEVGQRDHRQTPKQPRDTARDQCTKQQQNAFISRA